MTSTVPGRSRQVHADFPHVSEVDVREALGSIISTRAFDLGTGHALGELSLEEPAVSGPLPTWAD